MNLPLRTWTLTADALPERLLGAQEETGFTLPGADALAAFAGLLGVEEEKAPAAKEQPGAPFDLPALIPQDVEGCFTLSREIDFGELAGDRAELRLSMVCGRGEALLCDPAHPGDAPRRLCRFGDGPLALDLTAALESQKRLRISLRFDGARPAGVPAPAMLCVASDAALGEITLRPMPARLLSLDVPVTAQRAGEYHLTVTLCPAVAPDAADAPPARAVTLRLDAGETRHAQLSMNAAGEVFAPGRPYAAPAVKLTLRRAGALSPCDERALLYGYPGAPATSWLPLTPRECLLPPQTLLDRLEGAHVASVLLPVAAPDALYIALTRAGVAVRQIAAGEEQPRLSRFPCVTLAQAERAQAPDLALSAWQLCGMTGYPRTPDPGMTPAELLDEAAGKRVDAGRAAEVLTWLRAVRVRLHAEAVRQGRAQGALCAPGEWNQPDILDAVRTALAPTHLSALPLYGAWWTGTHFSASVQAFVHAGETRALRAVVSLEDAQGNALARLDASCPAHGGMLGLIEARLPETPCVLELTCRLLDGETAVETHTLPVYVGERGPLEAAFA